MNIRSFDQSPPTRPPVAAPGSSLSVRQRAGNAAVVSGGEMGGNSNNAHTSVGGDGLSTALGGPASSGGVGMLAGGGSSRGTARPRTKREPSAKGQAPPGGSKNVRKSWYMMAEDEPLTGWQLSSVPASTYFAERLADNELLDYVNRSCATQFAINSAFVPNTRLPTQYNNYVKGHASAAAALKAVEKTQQGTVAPIKKTISVTRNTGSK
ncbi:unnamed protein product [Amoebophrya sp. A25]|nr:unnamed protein product [Amoebophrya sp. A25]|eukprot:GSA25T00013321001.1